MLGMCKYCAFIAHANLALLFVIQGMQRPHIVKIP